MRISFNNINNLPAMKIIIQHRILCLLIAQLLFPIISINAEDKRNHTGPGDTKKYNVLMIISDDLRNELNCYGAKHMVTPNIDKIASRGIQFNRAYVQQAVCAASRASFLTGLRPNTTGSDYPYSIYTVEELLEKDHPSIMRYFMNRGYYVRGLGKIHHGYVEDFTEPNFNSRKPNYVNPESNQLKGMDRPPTEVPDVDDNAYRDGENTTEAINTLHRMRNQDKPFFLAVGYYKPHLPWCAPKKYFDLYDPEDIPLADHKFLPENAPEYATGFGNLNKYELPDNDDDAGIFSDSRARELKHAYAACVSYIDAQVGKLLDELDELGLKENTIVIFMSDHGWHLGDQGKWGKSTNFENATKAPLIITAPGFSSGQQTDALVEYVDIFPSLCELAGVEKPDYLEGTSVVPLLNDPERTWKKAVFSQYPRGYPKAEFEGFTIRTDRYRYVEWRELDGSLKAQELYDHKNDPLESVSVIHDENYTGIMCDLMKQLRAGWKSALPDGIENHSDNPQAPEFVPWGPEARFGPYADDKKK